MKIRHCAALLSVALLYGFAPHARTAPTRWALVIGISDYTNFGEEIGGDLPGAAEDARRMRDVLVARWGFEESHVRLVLNGEATRARIARELKEWLPSVAKENDLVVFYFAGHGSQMWDTSGDEPDGLDETICPTDVLKGNTGADIPDDELNAWLGGLPTSNVVAILDNCHAGTGTRAVTPFARPRALDRDVAADVTKPAEATVGNAAAEAESDAGDGRIELAGAQADEVALDLEWMEDDGTTLYGGAFTTSLVKQLWSAPRRTSYAVLFDRTVEDMKRQKYTQAPLLTGAAAAPAFAGEASADDRGFVPVVRVDGDAVTLGGGAAAGITPGSIWRSGDALLTVREVSGAAAVAHATGGAPRVGAPATLHAYAFAVEPLRISVADVAGATRAELATALSSTAGVSVVSGPRDFAHLLVRPAEQGYRILGMDGATRHEIPAAGATQAIAAAIRQELSAHQLAALENPASPFELAFALEGGRADLEIGDPVAFEVRSARDGYLTVVDLGTDGTVTVLFPNEDDTDGRVRAGELVRLPQSAQFEAVAPAGRGIVRAFVTAQPLGLAEDANPELIAQAIRAAAGGAASSRNAAVPVGSWATASIVYTIHP